MKIYVDFDRTLFDCDKFLEDLYSLINQYNIPKSLFKDCQNQCKKRGFNPHIILSLVKEKYDFDDNLIYEIDNLIGKTSEYLYEDAISFLEYLKEIGYEIIILTKGNSDYQREKIFNAHLDNYYNKLMVTMKHKGTLNIDYEESIFIDDNPIEIQSILNKKPKMIIRMGRINSKYSDIKMDIEIKEVKSLKEIIDCELLKI